MHHHWINESNYIERLLREMDRLGIERTGLMAMGVPFRRLFLTEPEPVGCVDNTDMAKLLARRADRFFGYGFFHLGQDEPALVDQFVDQGFVGVKFHIPAWDYDDERSFPVYERAQAHGLICLFHTGVFALPEPMPQLRASSARCRPIMLDAVTHAFPSLQIIIAHLGVCWGEEAATVCRIHPNIHADLSGAVQGWRASKSIEWFREMLYWPNAYRKVVFGSDVHLREVEQTLQHQTSILSSMGWSPEQIEYVLHHNAARLLCQQS